MHRSKQSKKSAWIKQHCRDPYVRMANQFGYRSRAAFKLMQIQSKHRLLTKGNWVLDLGASPGGFSQIAAEAVGDTGRVVAVDRCHMLALRGVEFVQGDLQDRSTQQQLSQCFQDRKADCVISDIAPDTTGIQMVDQYRSIHLVEAMLEHLTCWLKPGGSYLVKVFEGVGFLSLKSQMRSQFEKLIFCKPKASREHSKEVYVLAKGLLVSS